MSRITTIAETILGWTLLTVGIAGLVLPGPGLLTILAALIVLSRRYAWARRRVDSLREAAIQTAVDSVQSWWKITLSCLGAAALLAAGALWEWHPDAPAWWPLSPSWWLPGGRAVGTTLLISGITAFATITYGLRNFRRTENTDPRPESKASKSAR